MSETTSRSNPRLDNFEVNKQIQDQADFEKALYDDAGIVSFTDEDRMRIKEADAYERHMEALASDDRTDVEYSLGTSELYGTVSSPAFAAEHDDALVENGTHDAATQAAYEAKQAQFANDPRLRQMVMIAENIAQLKNRLVTPETADTDSQRLTDLEDRLQDLMVDYSSTEGNYELLSDIIDRTMIAPSATVESNHQDASETESSSSTNTQENDTLVVDIPSNTPSAQEGESFEEYEARNSVDPSLRIEEGDMPILRPREIEIDVSESLEIDDNAAESHETSSSEAVAEADKRLRTWFNRAKDALHTGSARGYVTAREKIDKLKQSTGQKEYETPEDYEARMKLSGRLYALGIVVVAAVILADKFAVGSGADILGTSGSGSGGGSAHLETAQFNHIDTTNAHGSWGGSESFSTNAFTVDPGEGWNQTFKDMNIPQSEWSDVLQKAGPQLKENGWAYQMPNGQWGISKSGQLPQSMLQLIDNSRTK